MKIKKKGDFLSAPWLRPHALNARNLDSSPDGGTEIPQAAWCSQKIVTVKNFLNFVRAALASVQQHQGLRPGLSRAHVYMHICSGRCGPPVLVE